MLCRGELYGAWLYTIPIIRLVAGPGRSNRCLELSNAYMCFFGPTMLSAPRHVVPRHRFREHSTYTRGLRGL